MEEETAEVEYKPVEIDEKLEKSFWKDILCEIIGSMDPWDVDLSELATRYSQRVDKMKTMDFRIPANVVIVSSVLLRMKSQLVMFTPNGDEGGFDAQEFLDEEEMGYSDLPSVPDVETVGLGGSLSDGQFSDYLLVKPKRVLKRRITAVELISAIQQVLEDRVTKTKIKENFEQRKLVININTDIRLLIDETYGRVMAILDGKKYAVFSELAQSKEDLLSAFISLLHLSNSQRLLLKQEKIFDEIYIYSRQ